jgi:hypothetical protein
VKLTALLAFEPCFTSFQLSDDLIAAFYGLHVRLKLKLNINICANFFVTAKNQGAVMASTLDKIETMLKN